MYCSKCGKENADTATFCSACGNSLSTQTPSVQESVGGLAQSEPRTEEIKCYTNRFPDGHYRWYICRIAALVFVLFLAVVAELRAQEAPVAQGDRVRISARIPYGRVVGTVAGLSADTLMVDIRSGDARLAVPLASVTRLEVSRGQKSAIAKGARIGFLVGAGVGVGVGALFGAGLGEDVCSSGCVGAFAGIGALGGGAVGTLIGLGIGASSKTDQWEAVPLNHIRVGLTPITPHGLGATVRVRWSP